MVFTSRYRFGRRGIQIHGKRVPQNPVRLHVSISELSCCFPELCIYTTIPWFRTCKENTTYEVKFLHCPAANPYLAKQKIQIRFAQQGTKYQRTVWDLLCDSFELWRSASEWGRPASQWCANFNAYWANLHCTATFQTVSRDMLWRRENGRKDFAEKKNLEMLWFLMLSVLLIL